MDTLKDEEKIINIYRRLEPSPTTTTFMKEIREETNNLKIQLNGMNKDLNYIKENLDSHIKDQKDHENKVELKLDISEQNMHRKFDESKNLLQDFIESADEKYADSEQFKFWRNILISGILISIAIGIVGLLLEKAFR